MFDPLTIGFAIALGGTAITAYLCGVHTKRRPIVVKKSNPFDIEGNLPPNVAYFGARQVMDYALDRGEDVQYLRARAALERYETDKMLSDLAPL